MAEALLGPECGSRQPGGAFDNESMSALCPSCGVWVRPPVGRWRVGLFRAATAAAAAVSVTALSRPEPDRRELVGLATFGLLLPVGAWAFFLSWPRLPPARVADAEPGGAADRGRRAGPGR